MFTAQRQAIKKKGVRVSVVVGIRSIVFIS